MSFKKIYSIFSFQLQSNHNHVHYNHFFKVIILKIEYIYLFDSIPYQDRTKVITITLKHKNTGFNFQHREKFLIILQTA